MLGLLIKYNFRALNKVMIPLQAGVLVAAVFGTFCTSIAVRSIDGYGYYFNEAYATAAELFSLFSISIAFLLAIILFSLIFTSSFITLALIARNIYKNFYSSEGYLSFTLPVTAKQHILSKIISGFTWMLINSILIILSICLLLLFGIHTDGFVNQEALDLFSDIFVALLDPLWMLYFIEVCFLGILSLILGLYQVLFSIIIGGALARTHKVLASIGIYIASSIVVGTATSFLTFFTTLFTSMSGAPLVTDLEVFASSQPTLIAAGLLSTVFILIFHFTSKVSLERSLNLD